MIFLPKSKDDIINELLKLNKEQLNNYLLKAVINENVSVLNLLFEYCKIDVNVEDGNETALMWASRYGNLNAAKELIKRGANVNFKNKGGWSALKLAGLYGALDIEKLLISYGAKE